MRKSLFDNYAPQVATPPRLQPNIFARLARFSYHHSIMVLLSWCVLAAASTFWAVTQHSLKPQQALEFSAPSKSQKYLNDLNLNFPNLNSLIAINLSNDKPEILKADGVRVVSALESQKDNFDLVFAPGTGDYYDSHGILYHSLEDVKARVAYAKSLQPLFTAIAAAPTTESLATLVNEVSASIELGRDPQGLDALFLESAKSIQALMTGTERLVDWTTIAGLNIEVLPNSVLVFALPKSGNNAQSLAAVNNAIAQIPAGDGTATLVDQSAQITKQHENMPSQKNLWPAIAMALIFVGFALAAALGQFGLVTMIMAPVMLTLAIASGPFRFFAAEHVLSFWPIIAALLLMTAQSSARFSFIAVEALNVARSRESAVMLASQKQGRGLVLLTAAVMLIWCSLFALNNYNVSIPAFILVAAMAIGLLSTLTLIPALMNVQTMPAHWHAGEWLAPLHDAVFNNHVWRITRNLLALVAIVAAVSGFWFAPKILTPILPAIPIDTAVNILAETSSEAEAIVKKLKSVHEAQSVRWLGAFLPQQVGEKLAVLQELKDQFPRITPRIPQTSDILREEISTLQDSLQSIANSIATRKELRTAADDLRRSLELLDATSSNVEVMALENRIFGSFNVLADRAETLAKLDRPNLQTLDPQLKSLFLSGQNILRLEVTPIPGLSNAVLADVLAAQGFHVAHPALVAAEQLETQTQSAYLICSLSVVFSVFALLVATLELAPFLASLFTFAVFTGIILAALYRFQITPNPEPLLIITAAAVFMTSVLVIAFQKKQIPSPVTSNAYYAVEAWLPVGLLVVISIPFAILNLNEVATRLGVFTAVCVLALLLVLSFLRPLLQILRAD